MSAEELPVGPGEEGGGEEEPLEVRGTRHRDAQVQKVPKRKLFDKARRKVFLEWLAGTGNVVYSAAKAGVCNQTVWKHRMKDHRFAEAVDRALEQGVVRAKARLIEDRPKGPIPVDGDISEAELEPADSQIVLQVIREHERARAGIRKPGRVPRIATNKEVAAALRKRLRAYAARVRGRATPPRNGEGDRDAQRRGGGGPLHHPPPPAADGHAGVQTAPGSQQPVQGTGGPGTPRSGEERG